MKHKEKMGQLYRKKLLTTETAHEHREHLVIVKHLPYLQRVHNAACFH